MSLSIAFLITMMSQNGTLTNAAYTPIPERPGCSARSLDGTTRNVVVMCNSARSMKGGQ